MDNKNTHRDALSEGRVALAKLMTTQWFAAHGKQFFLALCAVAALCVFLFPWMRRYSNAGRSEYSQIEAAFSNWIVQGTHDPALFKKISDPISRHPELGVKFGTLIAQRLLSLGETKLAFEYAQAALKRTKALLCPYHALFSQNTLLISGGQLKEALASSYQLKKTLEEDEALWTHQGQAGGGRALYAYNLVRIASLEREAGSYAGESAAWEEVMRCAGWGEYASRPKTYDPEAFKMVAENFQSGEVSLLDYIHQRKSLVMKEVY
ncbi:MAG TPA: hypothetical protein VGJ00_02125 [Rhabdochlamydiaceae bacterium]|jgi:hypothetical protein